MSFRTCRILALVAAAWCVPAPAVADEPVVLRLEPRLNESFAKRTEGRPVYGSGERLEGRTEREISLEGDAELRRAGVVVRGDRISYYPPDDELVAVGHVRIVRQGNVFTGPELRLKLDANEGSFENPSYFLPAYGGRGKADRLEFLGPDRTALFGATYSTCRPEDPDWYLKADKIVLDRSLDEGRGQDASLIFKGRKILGAPMFGFPLSEERRSGFLAPNYSMTTRTGVEFGVPWYWNIAPNRDFTLYPRLMSRNGVQIGGQLRFLEPWTMGDVRFEYTPEDVSTHTSRYLWSVQDRFSDLWGWSGSINAKGVSDDNYFIDFSRSILTSAERALPRDFSALRTAGNWTFLLRASRFQNILESRAAPPYDRVPQLSATHLVRDVGGFDAETLFEAALFRRPLADAPEGTRFVVHPRISFPVLRPGWFVVPKVGMHLSQYRLSTNGSYETSLSRAVPWFSVDSGLVFERPTSYFGRQVTQTLEPRLFYVNAPYRDQARFPVFDTSLADVNFTQLFSENTFVGNDRIANVNQLTLAAVSRLIEGSGAETLRLAVGQRYYLHESPVQIAGLSPVTDSRSDLVFAASAGLGRDMSIDAGAQYAGHTATIPRLNLAWRYFPRDGRILNAGVRYLRDTLGQLDTSWRWPITQRWMALGRVNYSFLQRTVDPTTLSVVDSQKGIVESVAGFEYNQDCWTARALMQRFVTAQGTQTTAFFLQLQLSGLGSIGSNPFDILRRNIPGYRLPNDRLEQPSGFFGYE